MGFDNECILNIQSLAGEYFCPVCRLLVYPNEALQSQCTHLYCKPCLKYVVSTTRACPYDGFLVTEADSKPLVESNKTLAETIGKITVHCLYHRSGCPWQGPLSDCTTHCTGCAFGNSPVVCNRCGIQIVHRQVQEHAQNCPGVQPQAQPAEGAQDVATTTSATATAAQTGTATSQAQTSAVSMPGTDPNQQPNLTTQAQTAVQAAVPTAEQWYQQYYQQYPGYDPYQQHYQQYYPYQAVAQYQHVSMHTQASQSQLQPQLLPQSQAQVNLQQETNPAVQQQSQTQLQTYPSAHVRPQPNPVQPLLQNVPQYQQPPLQMQHPQPQIQAQPQSLHNPVPQPQTHSQTQHQTLPQHQLQPLPQPPASQLNQPLNPMLQPQGQHSSLQAVTGHHSYPQPQIHQQMQLVGPQHPQGGPPPQLQHPVQMQSQFPQQSPLLRPPQPHATIPNQQPGLLPSPGQVPNVSPAQPQPVHSLVHQPGLPVHQQPVVQPIQQANQQYVQNQQPFPGQPWGSAQDQGHQQATYTQQQMHPQAQLRPQGPSQAFHQPSHGYPHPPQNVSIPYGAQPNQAQSLAGRPVLPVHGAPTQAYAQPAPGLQVRPMHVGANQQSGNVFRANNQVRLSSEQQSWVTPVPSERQGDMEKGAEADLSAQKIAKKDSNDMDAGIGADAGELKTINSESDLRPVDGENKPIGEAKDPLESLAAENGEPSIKQVKENFKQGADQQNDVSNAEHSMSENKNTKDGPLLETPQLQEGEHLEEQKMKLQNDRSPISEGSGHFPPHGHMQSHLVSADGQGKLQLPPIHYGPSALQQRPVGPPLLQAPPLGPLHHTHLPAHPPIQQGPLAPGHPPSHYGPPSYGPEAEMFPNQRPNYTDGRQGMHSNMMGMNMASGPDLDRLRPFPDEHLNSFPQDPARRTAYRGEFEEDCKHFPRPSPLDTESVSKFGSHFFSARPLDRGPHGFGVDGAQEPLDKGSHGLNYDLTLNMEPHDGSAPPRFFPPFHHDRHLHDAEGPTAFHSNTIGRSDFPRTHPGFPGSHVPGYGRRHVDNLAARSPGRDYPGMSSRGFGAPPGLDDIHSRESRRFGDPISSSFRDNRFPGFPSRLHRGEIDGPGNLHMGEHLSGEFLGQDGRPSHMRRGDHFGPRMLPGHLRLGEGGFGASLGHLRMGELAGPGNFYHQRFGEPGFRSSFGGSYAGDLESFDNSRKRKSSMGWCRICKIDCETVEGLDLHSQTREHQKMAMDMVITIKKNAKKQKSAPSDHSSLENASKTRNASSEGRGDKH